MAIARLFPSTPQSIAQAKLKAISNKWMHRPDHEALRICMATAQALKFDTRPVWTMVIGAGSTGKSSFYLQAASAYKPHVFSDDISVPGLLSVSNKGWGQGVLKRLGKCGLWLISDFTVMLNATEDKRNALMGAWRKIYDGHFERSADGDKVEWHGHTHVLMACTPAIESFYRVHSDLGERFLQVRIERPDNDESMVRKVNAQAENFDLFQSELVAAAKGVLDSALATPPEIPFPIQVDIMRWSDFISMGRMSTKRNYRDEIVGVGHEEGTARAGQQLMGLVRADAMLMGELSSSMQMPLVRRVSMDCLPFWRRAVLTVMPVSDSISTTDLQEIAQISHPYTFARTLEELQAIGAVKKEDSQFGNAKVWLTDRMNELLGH